MLHMLFQKYNGIIMEFTFILLVAGSFIMGSSSAGMLSDAKPSPNSKCHSASNSNMPDSKP